MQILPGTWQWINTRCVRRRWLPTSAADNVRGGVLMLHSLLGHGRQPSDGGGRLLPGTQSVEQNGMYSDTQQYVNSVLALQSQYGGASPPRPLYAARSSLAHVL